MYCLKVSYYFERYKQFNNSVLIIVHLHVFMTNVEGNIENKYILSHHSEE